MGEMTAVFKAHICFWCGKAVKFIFQGSLLSTGSRRQDGAVLSADHQAAQRDA